MKMNQDYDFELLLVALGICVVLLILVINIVYFSIILSLVILIYLWKTGKNYFIYPPFDIRIANAFSFISSILTYLFLYATINNEVDKAIPLIPFTVNVLTEIIILIRIRNGKINGLTPDFCKQLACHRALFSASTILIFMIAILYTFNILPDYVIFLFSIIVYSLALIVIHVDRIQNIKCKSMHANLKQ